MMDWLLNANLFQELIKIFFSAVTFVVAIILYPFALIIQETLPSFSSSLDQISNVFDLIAQNFAWAVSAVAIPPVVIVMVVGYYTFILTSTLAVWAIKLVISWKRALIT